VAQGVGPEFKLQNHQKKKKKKKKKVDSDPSLQNTLAFIYFLEQL
jgi:hypothetical protein